MIILTSVERREIWGHKWKHEALVLTQGDVGGFF